MIEVFRVFLPTPVLILLISESLLLGSCYVLAAFLVLEVDPTVFLLYDGGFARVLPVVLTILFGLHLFDLYTDVARRTRVTLVLEIGRAIGLAFIVEALLSWANRNWMLPPRLMIAGSALSLACVAAWRVLYANVALRMFGTQRLLFVGLSPAVAEIAAYLESRPEAGLANLGYADDDHPTGQMLHAAPVLGPLSQLRRIAAETKPDRIVVGLPERGAGWPVQDLLELKFAGIPIEEAAAASELLRGRVCSREVRPWRLVLSSALRPPRRLLMLQSVYSTGIALLAMLVTLPLMLLSALAVKLTSRGPVLHRQTRVGVNGKTFVLLKFRSVQAEAEAKRGRTAAVKDDPRLTPLGRWLRAFRLDELPQLFNVLRGDMSIVGPRPERLEFAEVLAEQIPYYHQRHLVKPGVTGWAQIKCPHGETLEDSVVQLEYDLYYIKHLSLALDLYILLRTLEKMLRLREEQ